MNNDETINVKRENLLNAYKNASDEQKSFLENLFGTETFKPKDVRERIKTFGDAVKELGEDNKLVAEYFDCNNDNIFPDLLAYLKLRIITAALNEGWEPQFIPGEYRWAPYFVLYTQEEIDEMDEKIKARVVCRSYSNASADSGVSFVYYDSAGMIANFGSRLAFKSEKLAEYAGQQFIDVFADFMLG